jgi:hypothetical protein
MKHQGFIQRVISDSLVLVQDTSKKFWRISSSGEMTRLGNHKCQLQNAGVTFDFDSKSVTDFTTDLPDHDPDQKEESTIIYTRHDHTPSGFGFVRRNDCGCSLVFHHSAVVTWGNIAVGAECRHSVDIVEARAVAVEVELYQQSVSQ